MIIQVDSLYRDYNLFPHNSEFEMMVNGQPSSKENSDIRDTHITSNYIQYSFSWIGNSDGNNPYSKIKHDTFLTKIIPISGNKCIVIPETDEIKKKIETINYFNGLLFYNPKTNQSATIVSYDKEYFTIILTKPVFPEFFANLLYTDCAEKIPQFQNKLETGMIVNTSYHEKTNLNLLGVTEVEFQPQDRFLISKGIVSSMIVENVTKNWKRKIESVQGIFRHVVLESIPNYDSTDYFIVYKNPVLQRYVSNQKSFRNGVESFTVTNMPSNDTGTIFTDGNIIVHVEKQQVYLDYPGNHVERFKEYVLVNNVGTSIQIKVTNVGSGFLTTEKLIPFSPKSIVSVFNQQRNTIQYYTILSYQDKRLYVNYEVYDLEEIDEILPIYLYIVPYESIFPNLVAPLIATNNLVCVEAQLISLTLPNLPICGYNIFLADIPYVMVNFSNKQEQYSNLYSNVPSSVNHNFVCPIANIRNPRLNFVVVSCKEKAIFKFSPRDTLQFRVSLPSGERLSYVSNRFQNIFSCPPLNLPLNRNHQKNEPLIYPFILNYGITAVFEITIL